MEGSARLRELFAQALERLGVTFWPIRRDLFWQHWRETLAFVTIGRMCGDRSNDPDAWLRRITMAHLSRRSAA